MWATANMDIAAHWSYKTNDGGRGPELRASKWLSGLIDLQKKSTSSIEFAESIKKDLEPNEVYLFSPKGHVYSIKTGATPNIGHNIKFFFESRENSLNHKTLS